MNSNPAAGLSLPASLLQSVERRLPALLRRRAPESLPIALHRRRLYVLPTRFGFFFALVFTVMQLGALNYNNNAALLFTFLLGSAAFISVFHGFRNINGMQLASLRAQPAHVGEPLLVSVNALVAEGQGQRIRLQHGEQQVDADARQGKLVWQLSLATERRGWQSIGHLRLSSEWPLGMFHIWSWLRPDWRAMVYPRPEADPPPLPTGGPEARQQRARPGHEELRSLREYRIGDAPRLIAWKASARSDALLTRELEEPEGSEIELDWQQLGALGTEQRISRLTAWVLEARHQGLSWTLRLPEISLGPAADDGHLHRCLRKLALLPE